MIDNKINIDIIVESLKRNNIRYVIISPGGTNIPFVKAVQDDSFFRCYSVVDERSAIYFAIGIYLQTGEFVATSCTSAQATRNYIPGLTEAYYKKVPILAITMEKHPRFKYQDYMQEPDQTSLPKDSVKSSFELPFISDKYDVLYSKRLVNQAILELDHNGKGPVQICIPWLDFPIANPYQTIGNYTRFSYDKEWNISLLNKRVLLIVGEHREFDFELKEAIDEFCEVTNSVVYVNNLSNFNNKYTVHANLMLSTMNSERFTKYIPDIVISIGGQTGDYPLYNLISSHELPYFEHWSVQESGNIVDTYDRLNKIFQCTELLFFKKVLKEDTQKITDHSYYKLWMELENKGIENLSLPFSNAFIASSLYNKLPHNSVVQLSILNSLRVWNLFKLDPSIHCYSNVGAFGIDGGLSTLIGQSVVTKELCFMVIGDLAFFYDMNSIGIRHLGTNLRIILINNNGGVEFKYSRDDIKSQNRYIAAGNHFITAKGWAQDCGFIYISTSNQREFIDSLDILISSSDRPIILEAFVKDIDDVYAYNMIIESQKRHSISEKLKKSVKSILEK